MAGTRLKWDETIDFQTSNICAKVAIGNYIRLKLTKSRRNNWELYVTLVAYKEDGIPRTRACQAQRMASFGDIPFKEATEKADEWYRQFVIDQLSGAGYGLTDLL